MFDREVDAWEDLLSTINGIFFAESAMDRVIGALSSSRHLFCRFFRRSITQGRGGMCLIRGRFCGSCLHC